MHPLWGSHVFELGTRADPATQFVDCIGTFANLFSNRCSTFFTPENRVNVTLAYKRKDWRVSAYWHWLSGAIEHAPELHRYRRPSDAVYRGAIDVIEARVVPSWPPHTDRRRTAHVR